MRRSPTRRARPIAVAALIAGLLASTLGTQVMLAVPGTPTTTTVAWPANPVLSVASEAAVEVTVTPVPTEGGLVTVWWNNNGTPESQSAGSVDPTTGKALVVLWNTSPKPAGTYELSVAFTNGGQFLDSTSGPHTIEIVLSPNPVTLEAQANPVYLGSDAHLTALASHFTESIQLWDAFNGGAPVLVDTQNAETDFHGHYAASFTVVAPAAGSHVYTAISAATPAYAVGTSDPLTVDVTKVPTDPSWTNLSELKGGIPVQARFDVNRPGIGLATGATGTATVKEGAATLASCAVVDAQCEFAMTLSSGTHTLTLVYSGDATYATSQRVEQVEVPVNTVDASEVGLSLSTFYPYKDGYQDTVTARGIRVEAASVLIKVLSPTGKVIKTVSFPSGLGAWSWTWNGRTSTGTMYPAGRYRISQVLTDSLGTKADFSSFVTLSPKRLYTVTKTITKDYAHRSAQGSTSVAWDFSLPSAAVYKKLVFGVYAKSSPAGAYGPHDFRLCGAATYNTSCGRPAATIAGSLAWRNLTGSASYNRSGRLVRLYAVASVRSNLKQGRVTVTYAILK